MTCPAVLLIEEAAKPSVIRDVIPTDPDEVTARSLTGLPGAHA
jgi:hypothetical protein